MAPLDNIYGTDGKFKRLGEAAVANINAINARPTSQMSPNIVLPHKRQDPALTGEMPQQEGGNNVATETVPQIGSYDNMLEYMRATQVNEADANKRQRRREMLASIGDAISALSSMYQTTKGAPVTYQHGQNMDAEVVKRGERAAKDRASMNEKYMNYLKMQQAKDQADAMKAYRQQQLEETKRYHDAAIDRDEERTEAIRMKNFITAGADAEFNRAYYEGVYDKKMSHEDAVEYANQMKDAKTIELFNQWNERETQAAADKHAESTKKQENYQARTDKTKATPAKSTSKSKKGKGGSTSKKSSTKKPKAY